MSEKEKEGWKVDHRLLQVNSGVGEACGRVEGLQESVAKLFCPIEEHLVFGELINAQKTSEVSDRDLKG